MSSKISRLPRPIRERLNQRLDDTESSRTLLKWLNSLPEVQAVLKAEFEGQPVSKQNLSDWKKRGFRAWQIRRDAVEFATEDADDALPDALSTSITKKLAHWTSLRFAALARTLAPSDANPETELRQLQEFCQSVVSLRRGDFNADRVLLEQRRIALMEKHSDADLDKLFWEWTKRPDIEAKLHPQRDRDQVRQEVEKMLNFRLLGIPHDRSQPFRPNPALSPAGNDPNTAQPAFITDETADPALLI
jgi:hypothetical protein